MRDIVELRALPQRYARAVDARDIDALEALFHPEAIIHGTRGEQTLAEWLTSMRAPATFPTSMHLLGDPLIDLPEGGEVAGLDTYAVVYMIGGEGQGDMTLGIRYVDSVVQHNGRWAIKARAATTLWVR